MKLGWTVCLVWVGGCSSQDGASGEVGSDAFELQSGFFISYDDSDGGGSAVIDVSLTDVADLCPRMAGLKAGFTSAGGDASKMAAAWSENLPEDFWYLQLIIPVANAEASLAGTTLFGSQSDATSSDVGEFAGAIYHYKSHADEAFFEGTAEDPSVYLDMWAFDGGVLRIDDYVAYERIAATSMGWPRLEEFFEGGIEGHVNSEFDVPWCVEMEPYL